MIDNDISGLFDGEWISVSSGDALPFSSVSGGDAPAAYYEINMYMLPVLPPETETLYTLWDKPLEEYTVSEGLLLLLVVIALVALIWSAVRGGFKWQI